MHQTSTRHSMVLRSNTVPIKQFRRIRTKKFQMGNGRVCFRERKNVVELGQSHAQTEGNPYSICIIYKCQTKVSSNRCPSCTVIICYVTVGHEWNWWSVCLCCEVQSRDWPKTNPSLNFTFERTCPSLKFNTLEHNCCPWHTIQGLAATCVLGLRTLNNCSTLRTAAAAPVAPVSWLSLLPLDGMASMRLSTSWSNSSPRNSAAKQPSKPHLMHDRCDKGLRKSGTGANIPPAEHRQIIVPIKRPGSRLASPNKIWWMWIKVTTLDLALCTVWKSNASTWGKVIQLDVSRNDLAELCTACVKKWRLRILQSNKCTVEGGVYRDAEISKTSNPYAWLGDS